MDSSRRRFLAAVAAAGLAGCGGDGGPDPGPAGGTEPGGGTTRKTADAPASPTTATGGRPVRLETVTGNVRAPVAFADPADGPRYVADQAGVVRAVGRDRPFLDLRDRIVTGGERGLLGLALHPGYAENRRLFVRYSAPPRPGTPDGFDHTFVLSEFAANGDGTRADPGSERTLLEVPEPQSNHNSGSVVFGPDGLLYVGVGDGGAGGDVGLGHVEDWYGANGGGNGQDVTGNLLGSVLRIDPDSRTGGKPYGIPPDNPLVGREGFDEHYAWGLRNPWGMSFDSGELYVADVGQSGYEEVDRVRKGGNYGWNVREGTHCYRADPCPDATPRDVRGGEALLEPVVEYPHSGDPIGGAAVIGGYHYRGDAIPALRGRYVFGDLAADGRLFVASPADEGVWPVDVLEIARDDRGKVRRLLAFGRDRDGELYALTRSGVHRLAPSG